MVSLCCGFFWRKNNKNAFKTIKNTKLGNEETVQGFGARNSNQLVAWQCEGDYTVPSSLVNVFNAQLYIFETGLFRFY